MTTSGHRLLNSGSEEESTFEGSKKLKYHFSSDEMTNVTIYDLYYTYEIDPSDGTLVYYDHEGEEHFFYIDRIVFHAPSEHIFDGENYDLEM